MKKLLVLFLSAAGLFSLPAPEAGAAQPVPTAPVTQSGPTVLPGNVLEAPVVVTTGRRRRYRYVRRAYYVHGRRRYHSVRVVF